MWLPEDIRKLKINGDEVYDIQVSRPSQKTEISCLGSYNLNYSTLVFDLPMTYKSKLYEKLDDNKADFFDGKGVKLFSGYISQRSMDYGRGGGIIQLTATTWLGKLAKSLSIYDIAFTSPAALLSEIFSNLNMPYIVDSSIGTGLEGIELAVDSDGKAITDITLINDICTLLHLGIYLQDDKIKLFVLPETLLPGQPMNEKTLVGNQPKIDDDSSVYYDKIVFTYKNDKAGADKVVTVGGGDFIKTLSCANVYVTDSVAALITNRQYALLSTLWKTWEQTVSVPLQVGVPVSFDGHNFFVYSSEYMYSHYKIKCYGKRVS